MRYETVNLRKTIFRFLGGALCGGNLGWALREWSGATDPVLFIAAGALAIAVVGLNESW
jgi:hypothetical protein